MILLQQDLVTQNHLKLIRQNICAKSRLVMERNCIGKKDSEC